MHDYFLFQTDVYEDIRKKNVRFLFSCATDKRTANEKNIFRKSHIHIQPCRLLTLRTDIKEG